LRGREQKKAVRSRKIMTAPDTPHPDYDDMPAEIDFSGGTRGKFKTKKE